jgi:alpha-ribazole phosphatase
MVVAVILHLMRHAAVDGADGRCVGHSDVLLSASGRDAAREAASRWSAAALGVTRVVSSDQSRALETAALLVPRLPAATDARLREMHFGAWDGRLWADIEATDASALQSWMAEWTTVRTPDGESFVDLLDRVRAAIADVRAAGEDVLVIAHAGTIRAAAVALLDLPPARAFSLAVDHLQLTTFSLSTSGSTLLRWNASLC